MLELHSLLLEEIFFNSNQPPDGVCGNVFFIAPDSGGANFEGSAVIFERLVI